MIVGISMVKDEADIVEASMRHMLTQVDHVIVADNGSTDGTREILGGLDVEIIDDPEVGYYQSRKMTALAERARQQGAEWVVPFDADEIWLAEGRIADVLRGQEADIATAPIFNYMATALDPPDLSPVERLQWRLPEPLPLGKVACRVEPGLTIHAGNHGASYDNRKALIFTDLLEVRHFPYRSPEQFIRKVRNGAAAYKATNLPFSTGQHWREYGENLFEHGPEALRAWFREHFYEEDPESKLIHDPLSRGWISGALTVAERSPGLARAST